MSNNLKLTDTYDAKLFPSHWDKQNKIKRKKVIKQKKIKSSSDSEQSSVEDNSENKNESKCNEGKKCYDINEDSDCVEDNIETLKKECDILYKDLGIQLFHDGEQASAAIVKKINKRKQITDIENYKKKSKLNFLTDETDIDNLTAKQNIDTNINSYDKANVCEQNINKTNSIINKLKNHKTSTDVDRFTLTDENYFKTINSIRCFGMKSSSYFRFEN